MERLTERTAVGVLVKEDYGEKALKTLYSCNGGKPNPHYTNCDEGYCAMEKLAAYEDADEQGLLLWLPCKVGDSVYRFWYVDEKPYKVQTQVIRTLANLVAIMESGEFGKSVFLSLEEAENKLKEMESSHAENRSV